MNLQFVEIDEKEFVEKEIDVSEIISKEELIEKINEENYDENKYYKLILVGNKKVDINSNDILNNIIYKNIIKIKDKTKLEIDLENISRQNNLKGIFVKELLEKMEKEPENKELIRRAIEIGLLTFENS